MKIKNLFLFLGILGLVSFSSCELTEELNGELSGQAAEEFLNENTDVSALLRAAYLSMRMPFQHHERLFTGMQHTTDETMGPTRGGDWDDNGIWRVLHDHTWTPEHAYLGATFDEMLQVVFQTTNLLSFQSTGQAAAEARFLRAFTMFTIVDMWGQVPFREPGENLLNAPRVLGAQEALDFILSEVEAVENELPDGPATVANKDAAKVLKMKVYLNRGAFLNRSAPTFDPVDMQKVVSIADEIIDAGNYSLAVNVFDNFAPNNDVISTENIFTGQNDGGVSSGLVQSRWYSTLHYNMNPSGWNGFCTIADFYNLFDDNDTRKTGDYPGHTDVGGIKIGFLEGQQFDVDGNALEDRKENPLSFTVDVNLRETGDNLEVTGVRVLKYPIDYTNPDIPDNDYVYYRYADVLLMKAEALLRTGGDADALDIVNELRTARGADTFGSITLDILIDERGREFYWENMRRQDLIRFGKFLDAWNEKPASDATRLLFPIPVGALAVNPNLTQNPGY